MNEGRHHELRARCDRVISLFPFQGPYKMHESLGCLVASSSTWAAGVGELTCQAGNPPPPHSPGPLERDLRTCVALEVHAVQATVGVGTVLIWDLI